MYSMREYTKEKSRQEYYIFQHFHMEYSTRYLGRQKRDGWECFAYTITLKSIIHPNPATFTNNFYTGIGHALKETQQPYAPLPFSVLSSIYLDDPKGATFDDWCAEFGYDTDSRKALSMYLQCQEQTTKFRRAFPHVNLEEHEEITQY